MNFRPALPARRAWIGEHTIDLQTKVVHATKYIDESGGSTWCAYTFYEPTRSKSPVDDFQGEPCKHPVTCMSCINALSNEDAANAEEDAWRRSHELLP